MSLASTLRAALGAAILAPVPALAAPMIGLTDDNALVAFDHERRAAARPAAIVGLPAGVRILGIDVRPADRKLYGVGSDAAIYAIDPASAAATLISKLDKPLPPRQPLVVDFNPAADRLRLMAADGTNYRVNVDTGAAIVDGRLAYAPGVGAGAPRIIAGAYSNGVIGGPKPEATALYTFDDASKSYMLQSPPNDGVQAARGPKAIEGMPPLAGFDILARGGTDNVGVALFGLALHQVDLANGALTLLGSVTGTEARLIDVAFLGR